MAHADPEPFQLTCPLCDHQVQVARTGEQCQFCGAELHLFDDPIVANQFAENCKSRGENAKWLQTRESQLWVVAHKGGPSVDVYERLSRDTT